MSSVFHTSTSISVEAFSTPKDRQDALLGRSGWTSSTADKELSTKRQSLGHSGSVLKRQKTPSTCLTTSNEQLPKRIEKRLLNSESDNDGNPGGEDMNENDLVARRNFVVAQDCSPEDSEVKVLLHLI